MHYSAKRGLAIACRPSVCPRPCCGPMQQPRGALFIKTADWIRMPFGMVSGIGRGVGVLEMGWLSSKGKGQFLGVNLGRLIVTNGTFVT